MGSVNHEGSGFTLTAGATKVTLDDFVVDPGNSMLYGSVNGTPGAPLLSLDGTNVKVTMESGNVVLFGTVAKLTDAAASALNGAFKTQAIKAGTPLGVVRLVAKGTATTYTPATDKTAQITRLGGKQTAVKLDAGTAEALKSLGVAVAPTGTGKFDAGTGTVSFPITGGFAAIHSDKGYKPGYIAGNVIHQGSGLKFSKGNQSIEVTDFVVDPGTSILTATAGGKSGIPLLSPRRHQRRRVDVGLRRGPAGHRRQADRHRRHRPELHLQRHRIQGGHPPGCRHPDRRSGRRPQGVVPSGSQYRPVRRVNHPSYRPFSRWFHALRTDLLTKWRGHSLCSGERWPRTPATADLLCEKQTDQRGDSRGTGWCHGQRRQHAALVSPRRRVPDRAV